MSSTLVPIRAVVFDNGGILIDWNPRYLYRKLIADEEAMEHAVSRLFETLRTNERFSNVHRNWYASPERTATPARRAHPPDRAVAVEGMT